MTNFPFADVYAERGGHRYAISVKIRNKFETTGRLNSRYKLGADCYRLAKLAETKLHAEAAGLAIALEPDRFSAYFGLLVQLGGNRGIAMTPAVVRTYEFVEKLKNRDSLYPATHRFPQDYRCCLLNTRRLDRQIQATDRDYFGCSLLNLRFRLDSRARIRSFISLGVKFG